MSLLSKGESGYSADGEYAGIVERGRAAETVDDRRWALMRRKSLVVIVSRRVRLDLICTPCQWAMIGGKSLTFSDLGVLVNGSSKELKIYKRWVEVVTFRIFCNDLLGTEA